MKRVLSALLVLLAILGVGCGGSTSGRGNAASRGEATVRIMWPVRSSNPRVIPTAANAIVVLLQSGSTTLSSGPIARPTSSWTSPSVAPGNYTLTATAYPNADGSGDPQATGTGSVSIVANTNTPSGVTMGSTVAHLAVSPSAPSVTVGETVALTASATDAKGNIVLVADSTVHWTTSNASVATITATGLTPTVSALTQGTATLSAQFTEVESSLGQQPVTAQPVTMTVTAANGGSGLADSSWPKFRGDAANTGRGTGSDATGTLTKWAFTLPVSSGSQVPTSALVIGQDGTLYVSTSEGHVYSLNASSGTQNWSVLAGTSGAGLPTLAASSDGTLYCYANTGSLLALDASSGIAEWSFSAPKPSESALTLGPDGTVYFAASDGTVYAVKGGSKQWSYNIGGGSGGFGGAPSSLALGANGTLYVCSTQSKLVAIDTANGAKLWSTSAGGGIYGTPSVGSDGTVYISTGGTAYAFSGATGATLWTFSTGGIGSFNHSVAIGSNGAVVVSGTIGEAGSGTVGPDYVYSLDAKTGTKLWSASIPDTHSLISSPVLASDGTVYVVDQAVVYALDGATGSQQWSYAPANAQSVFGDDVVLDSDGTLYATMNRASANGALFAIH